MIDAFGKKYIIIIHFISCRKNEKFYRNPTEMIV